MPPLSSPRSPTGLTNLGLSAPINVQITPDYDRGTPIGETPTHDGIYERDPKRRCR